MLFLPSLSRYSEDIDLVTVAAGPIGPLMDGIKAALLPWLDRPKYKQTETRVTFYFSYLAESPTAKPMRLKLEINTVENFTVFGYENRPLEIKTDWFAGRADIKTFTLDELLGTKLRALFQRKRGAIFSITGYANPHLMSIPTELCTVFFSTWTKVD